MIRRVIEIDSEKCTGCGICADACHEGAIGIVDGKATLLRDDYCDGLGDCLPTCPTGAITFVEREAAAYDEEAVKENLKKRENSSNATNEFVPKQISRLKNWPVQIKLVAPVAPYFDGADLLIAADCTGFAYANIHSDFMDGKVTLIGCPKLDDIDYSEKLTDIFRGNDIKSITILRMLVPCCGGIVFATQRAIEASGKTLPLKVVTIAMDGEIVDIQGE